MHYKLDISPQANTDLIDIYLYTAENFTENRADQYYTALEDRLYFICDHPYIGRSYDEVALNLWRYEFKSHSVYYKIKGDTVLILRILHQRMDPGRYIV